jgi:hypothetical protein
MIIEIQIKANQENAKKSTRPIKVYGRQRSSMNVMMHNIFAQIPILPGEDRDNLIALADAIN